MRPGLVRRVSGGTSIEVELWRLSKERLGTLLAQTDPPLGLGTVELVDGEKVMGFLCEAFAVENAEDITDFGGWRAYREQA